MFESAGTGSRGRGPAVDIGTEEVVVATMTEPFELKVEVGVVEELGFEVKDVEVVVGCVEVIADALRVCVELDTPVVVEDKSGVLSGSAYSVPLGP